jgi:uncharacterized protein YjbI with pentapeptide repeats
MKKIILAIIFTGTIYSQCNEDNILELFRAGQNIRDCQLQHADLSRRQLAELGGFGTNLRDANLSGANLTGANLTNTYLGDANLSGANLTDANLTGANLTGVDLSGADLSGADLTRTNLPGANLTDANLTGANLTNTNLADANLRSADMTGANLTGATLRSADMTGADLSGADMTDSNLRAANLRGGVLSDANLSGADLSHADLRNTVLVGADLTGAQLSYVNLQSADLSNVTLYGAFQTGFSHDPEIDCTSRGCGEIEGIPAALPLGWTLLDGMLTNKAPFRSIDENSLIYDNPNELEIENLDLSTMMERVCNNGNGPWLIKDSEEPTTTAIQLSQSELSIIESNGTVCFCEGETNFSAIITSESVNLLGNGNKENIIVKPLDEYNFHLISFNFEALQTLNQLLDLNVNSLEESNLEKPFNLSIENLTITSSDLRGTNRAKDINSDQGGAYEDCVEDQRYRHERLIELGILGKDEDIIDYCTPLEVRLNNSAVQINRLKTNLNVNNTNFTKLVHNSHVISLSSNINLQIANSIFAYNNLLINTSGNLDALSLDNIEIYKNDFANLFFISEPQNKIKARINNVNIYNNKTAGLFINSAEVEVNNLVFKDNSYNTFLQIFSNDSEIFNLNQLRFENNNNLTISIVGNGSISNSVFKNNNSDIYILNIVTKLTTISESSFIGNAAGTDLMLFGNLNITNSGFLNTRHNGISNLKSSILSITDAVDDFESQYIILAEPLSREDLITNKITLENVDFEHLMNRENEASIVAMGSNSQAFSLGGSLEQLNSRDILSVYWLGSRSNRYCRWVNERYLCEPY